MKSNKFLGLVGVGAALFSALTMACAAPAVQHSSGADETPTDESNKSTGSSTSNQQASSIPTQPVTSTATTTGTTTTTTPTTTTPAPTNTVDPLSCTKLATCANGIDDTWEKLSYLGISFAGDQGVCAKTLIACSAGGVGQFFGNKCDDLTDCCTDMGSNGNSGTANACRQKANAGDANACKSQLDTYQAQGLCN